MLALGQPLSTGCTSLALYLQTKNENYRLIDHNVVYNIVINVNNKHKQHQQITDTCDSWLEIPKWIS